MSVTTESRTELPRSRLRALLAWVPAAVLVATFLELVFLLIFAATDGYDVARNGEVLRVALTFAAVFAMFVLPRLVLERSPRLELAATALGLFVFSFFNVAKQLTGGAFDYGFVHDSAKECLTPLGWHILASSVGWGGLALLVGLPAAGALVVAMFPRVPWAGGARNRVFSAVAAFVLLVLLPARRVGTHESVTEFVTSALRFHAELGAAGALIGGERYPYVHAFRPSDRARSIAAPPGSARPHVILLFMESWGGLFVDRVRADGRRYTPIFDAHRREGLSYEHFYGNSMQSSRGHFATLCSLVPVFRGKEFTDFEGTRLHCLPEVLREVGYRTLFYSATAEPNFENSSAFFARIGVERAEFQRIDAKTPDPDFWGTGVQDDAFYKRFFRRLDDALDASSTTPLFAIAANASHHYPFREGPSHVPEPHESTQQRRDFVASLAAADAWLAVFFEELERRPALRDAIVVLVGDHGFPASEHGIHFNQLGSYEEAFRTGFLLRWRGHVAPELVRDTAASQLDLAPTIADLLQLGHRTHFQGRSLVSGEPPRAQPMVQPYDGVRLVAVQFPWKLVRHEAAEQELLYDLARDPNEEHNLLGRGAPPPELAELRKTILWIHANQALMRENRIWP